MTRHTLPSLSVPTQRLPRAMEGAIYQNVGRYARGAVLYAFEAIGGADALSDWAKDNPDDFYTKLFPKIITKEVEVNDRRGVDDLMDLLDVDYEVVQADDGAGPHPASLAAGGAVHGAVPAAFQPPAPPFERAPPPPPTAWDEVAWTVDDWVDR